MNLNRLFFYVRDANYMHAMDVAPNYRSYTLLLYCVTYNVDYLENIPFSMECLSEVGAGYTPYSFFTVESCLRANGRAII
jgi:hypothetical protein